MEAICALLDVERVNTTPGHPRCDGQSEKSVQQIKKMIRAYCDENQDNWDLGVTQLCFAYNSSVHETTGLTPFEVMFGRDPIIPIDLIYPNRLEFTRESINENQTVQRSEIGPVTINPTEKFRQIDILKDVPPDEIEPKCPAPIKQYIGEKREHFQVSYALLKHHRMLKMSRAQRNYNHRIKRTSYEIGHLVLVCHPMLK